MITEDELEFLLSLLKTLLLYFLVPRRQQTRVDISEPRTMNPITPSVLSALDQGVTPGDEAGYFTLCLLSLTDAAWKKRFLGPLLTSTQRNVRQYVDCGSSAEQTFLGEEHVTDEP